MLSIYWSICGEATPRTDEKIADAPDKIGEAAGKGFHKPSERSARDVTRLDMHVIPGAGVCLVADKNVGSHQLGSLSAVPWWNVRSDCAVEVYECY